MAGKPDIGPQCHHDLADCGAEFYTAPCALGPAQHYCETCQRFSSNEQCHRCTCTACSLEVAWWRNRIALARRAHPLPAKQLALDF